MGAVLVRSAFSANIKERRDCSTALFDAHGRMIAQAEHIPVHLGAMPDAVAAVMRHEPARDDVWILNDPYTGGTHLPDITLVSRTEVGFAVTRAHHADVGGAEPGSMPADSSTLDEEGVVIPPTRLDDKALDALVAQMRNPEERRGDLRAQLAAHGLAEPREGCLVNARPPAAVAAGNVETSSRIVDVVMRAFGRAIDVPAQGQGTMNNVTLGNERFTYYETIGGGQGACPDADGPSGVHVAMSNTLSTPVEALELQYPLQVERYGLRLGSGGAGAHRGGDGVVRELRVVEDCRLSIISERRAHAPQGERGGAAGASGRNLLNGRALPAKVMGDLGTGDVVTVETPGGGGWGS